MVSGKIEAANMMATVPRLSRHNREILRFDRAGMAGLRADGSVGSRVGIISPSQQRQLDGESSRAALRKIFLSIPHDGNNIGSSRSQVRARGLVALIVNPMAVRHRQTRDTCEHWLNTPGTIQIQVE